jgi:hypothetical protein
VGKPREAAPVKLNAVYGKRVVRKAKGKQKFRAGGGIRFPLSKIVSEKILKRLVCINYLPYLYSINKFG